VNLDRFKDGIIRSLIVKLYTMRRCGRSNRHALT
jgi:hypothetical protein